MRRLPEAIGAFVLAALLLAPSVGAATPELERMLRGDDIGSRVQLEAWSGKRPSLADVDGDGDLDLLEQNANRRVYAIDLREGRVLVEVEPHYPYGPDLGPFNGPKAGDLDGDGRLELVNVNRAAVATAWTLSLQPDGSLSAEKRWEVHLDEHYHRPSADAAPVLADLDADGVTLEVLVQTEERGSYALRHDGSILWSLNRYGGNAEPLAHDLDGDGDLDAVWFTDGGRAYAVDGATGEELWAFEARHHGAWPASIATSGTVADLDGDGTPEVAFCARNVEDATTEYAPGAPHYRQHHLMLFVVREGKLVWKAKPSWANPLCAAQIMSADVDGDGKREVYGMDWNTIGHKPGNWEQLGDAHAFAFSHDGRELWHRSLDAYNAKPNIALADATGDGEVDVLAYDRDGLVVLDASSGARLHRVDFGGRAVKQGPLVADLAGDGIMRAVVLLEGKGAFIALLRLPATELEPPWPGWEPPVASPQVRAPEAPSGSGDGAGGAVDDLEPAAPARDDAGDDPPAAPGTAPPPTLVQEAPAFTWAAGLVSIAAAALVRRAARQ